jgi:molybdate transport system ATP-binding protein
MSLSVKVKLKRDKFSLSVDVKIASHGITAIYGASGCGKTTLLRCIAGLEETVSGSISFGDEVWLSQKVSIAAEGRAIGYVFQEASLFPHLNVLQNISYGLSRKAKNKQIFELYEVVELLGLENLLEQDPQLLSGGERQRVAIARAILRHPRILLMDEPLAALDKKSKQTILPYLEKIHQRLDLPIIYVSHSEEEIARLADNLIVIEKGKVIAQGELLAMLSNLNSPLSKVDNCFGLIDCVVSQINKSYHLAQLSFDGLSLRLPCGQLSIGQKARVRVLAKDISLCLSPPEDSSILNILPVTIVDIKLEDSHEGAQCLVSLQVGGFYLIARISEYSRQELKLQIGLNLYAQIKAMALLG